MVRETDWPNGRALMAKLTLSFKDRILRVFALQSGEYLIGRESDCGIPIDSLAVEPRHARIRQVDEGFVVEPMVDTAHISVNEQPVKEAQLLEEGDQIQVGKHTLRFSLDSDIATPNSVVRRLPMFGWIQIQSGNNLGRIIRLNKALTRIGKTDGDLAVIAHRDQGYYLSHLQGENTPQINQKNIGEESCKLHNGDQISVGALNVQFFADANAVEHSDVAATEQAESQQRQFARFPLAVCTTLVTERQSWISQLVDISLHGALIKEPQDFKIEEQGLYQLLIHLQGGPDICMDVLAAHHQNGQLGLRCVNIDVDSITHLRRLLQSNLDSPELLQRELSALG